MLFPLTHFKLLNLIDIRLQIQLNELHRHLPMHPRLKLPLHPLPVQLVHRVRPVPLPHL